MNSPPDGPLARVDRAALEMVGKLPRVYTWPTTTILVSFWTFLVGLFLAVVVSRFFKPGSVREVVVIVVPLLTLLLHVGMTYLVYRACDEYLRQRILRCAAFAGAVLAFATVANFSLASLGYFSLPLGALNLCAWSLFIVLMLWVRHRAR